VITELEYENLLTALQLALTAQVSILHPYRALSSYLDRTQDQRRGLDLGQMVLSCLETYSPDKLADRVGAEFVGVIDDIANRQRLLKRYTEAEASYQKALALHLRIRSFDEETSKKLSAGIYHQLGMVAQEQRQWAQAEQYYQQALQIKIEFKDRYEQARTYHQLGRVAEEQRQWPQARDYFLIALETFVAYNDTYSGTVVLRSLVRLWQVSGDGGLPASIATVLGVSPGEVETALRELLGNEGGG
jgi:tetratricopeptide (TPR) repeat protein